MSTHQYLLIGISSALGLCVVALVVLLAAYARRTTRADGRVDGVVRTLEARLDDLAAELAGAVERAEEGTRRSRFLAELAGSIDLDEILDRILNAAAALPGVDATLIRLDMNDGTPIVSARGISADRAEHQALSGPPGDGPPRAVELVYRYPEQGSDPEAVRSGVAVPLLGGDKVLGYLGVFSRDPDHRFGDEDVLRLEEMTDRAGPAIETACRFREARQLANLDALTGLHNRRYFHETLAREVDRSHRYHRQLALVIFDLDGFKEVNDRIGHLAGDAVLAEVAERIAQAIRSADVACRVGGDEFAVILPESNHEQAQLLASRVQRAVTWQPLGRAGGVRISAGVAELQPEDDAISLFERADARLYSAKHRGAGMAAEGP